MGSDIHLPPRFSPEGARELARTRFDVRPSEVRELPSDRDQNFLVVGEDGSRFVLKLANGAEDRSVLELQNALMAHLHDEAPELEVSTPAPSDDPILEVEGPGGGRFYARLLRWVPGTPLAETHPRPPALLRSLGRFMGRLDRALASFSHPADDRFLKWDLRHAGRVVTEHLEHVENGARRELVEELLGTWRERVRPVTQGLRRQVIHGDANDHNVLVGRFQPDDQGHPGRRVVGLVDFGDAVRSWTVAEPAVAAAYAMLDRHDPLEAAAAVVEGYHRENPLGDDELRALFPLACMRLCLSVTIAAHQKKRDPENRYLTVTEAPAWALLERLVEVSPDLAHFRLREACGREPCPLSPRVRSFLRSRKGRSAPVLGPEVSGEPVTVFDLSVAGTELGSETEGADARVFTDLLFRSMQREGAVVGVGRWNEPRRLYASEAYETPDEGPERRTVHLGVDLFVPPGSPVFAPLPGRVVSALDNDEPLDYGPTVILEHRGRDQGGPFTFYTLYGHLARSSLAELEPGAQIAAGGRIGSVGAVSENGGWPPHLHVQVLCHLLGREGNFPGVGPPSRRELWASISPYPGHLLDLPAEARVPAPDPDDLLERRERHLGPNLSLAYRRPLHIVRGFRQYLWDAEGRRYLDAVNNVPHVGHSHPRVVEAARRQMAVLNTNTRYLHEEILRYVERLVSTLPEPLSVCWLVNSGSEANELALRLARAHTGRREVVVQDGGYHGNTGATVELSPYKFQGPGGGGRPEHVHVAPLPDPYRGLYRADDPDAGPKYALHVREALDAAGRRGGAAAFFAEPLVGCGGQVVPPAGYLEEAFRHAREAGAVCVADEVQVGFGRVGTRFWAFQAQGAVPDVVTLGKPMGNGHPVGAVITTPEIAASFDTGMEYFNTFGGNPVSCAVAAAVLDVLMEEDLQENAARVGRRLLAGLAGLMDRHPLVGDVRGMGLYLGVELMRDREARRGPAGPEAAYVAERTKDLGVLISTDGPDHNVLKIKPPMCFTEDDADELVGKLDRVLAEDYPGRRGRG